MRYKNIALTPEQIKAKIYRYCAYQERCHQEVHHKLKEMGLRQEKIEEWIAHLVMEGFLNEGRYAKAFAGGKFRMKNWGRLKIIHALEGKGLTHACIKTGLKEIDEADYMVALEKLLANKLKEISPQESVYVTHHKAAQYAIQKGFEPDLVWKMLKGWENNTS